MQDYILVGGKLVTTVLRNFVMYSDSDDDYQKIAEILLSAEESIYDLICLENETADDLKIKESVQWSKDLSSNAQ